MSPKNTMQRTAGSSVDCMFNVVCDRIVRILHAAWDIEAILEQEEGE